MRTGSLTALSMEAGMPSINTIQKIARHNAYFPVIQRGGRGKAFVVDLDAAAEFLRQWQAGRFIRPEAREIAKRELGLGLLGGTDA